MKTSEQELGFATAEFGEEQTQPFQAALVEAQAALSAAFRTQQALDDSKPEDEATRRQMLSEIIRSCTAANERLDAEADAFDALRDIAAKAPQLLDDIEERAAQLTERLGAGRDKLAALSATYAASHRRPGRGERHPGRATAGVRQG